MPFYLITAVLYFWVPLAVMGPKVYARLEAAERRAFWLTLGMFYPMAAIMEFVYLYYDIWTFSEDVDPLTGLHLYGAPIEEFVFWFGAVPFALMVYFNFCRIFPKEHEAARVGRRHGKRRQGRRTRPNAPVLPVPARTKEKELVPLL